MARGWIRLSLVPPGCVRHSWSYSRLRYEMAVQIVGSVEINDASVLGEGEELRSFIHD